MNGQTGYFFKMTQLAQNIQGSIVALVTPMLEDGNVDWKGLEKLVEWHIQQGTNAIVAVGTTGESSTLSMQEHAQVIQAVIRVANKRIPVIAGTGANSTHEAVELTKEAHQLGADAVLSVVPYYNKPTQEGLYQHFKAIAESADIPVILYNVPGRTVADLANDTVLRLAQIDNIIGIKDATGNLTRGKDLIDRLDGQINVYSGDDDTAAELILLGGQGNISVTANIAPHAVSQICHYALAGDTTNTRKLSQDIAHLNQILFCESNPIPVKWALYEMGMMPQGIRLPLTPLAEQYHADVRNALKAAKLI